MARDLILLTHSSHSPLCRTGPVMGVISTSYYFLPNFLLILWDCFVARNNPYFDEQTERLPSTCVRNESLRDNINAAKTLVIILIVFFVCWFPFFTTYFLSFVLKVIEWDRSGAVLHKDQLLKYPTCALHKAFMVCTNNQIKLRIKRKNSIWKNYFYHTLVQTYSAKVWKFTTKIVLLVD